MKATIEIPDELYRRVKARSALLGKPVREVTIELYRRWLAEPVAEEGGDPDAWLREWLALADAAFSSAPAGPTARELLAEARNRLDRT
jgi:hypothetical protein